MKAVKFVAAAVLLLGLFIAIARSQGPQLTEERLFAMVGRLHAQVELLSEQNAALQKEIAQLKAASAK